MSEASESSMLRWLSEEDLLGFPAPWDPPSPSMASRSLPRASVRSYRVATTLAGRYSTHESLGEYRSGVVLIARPDICDVVAQQPVVNYTDSDGIARTHTFDLFALALDRTRYAIQFKPSAIAEAKKINELMALIASQMSPDIADAVLLMTEKDASARDALKAQRFLSAMGRPERDGDDEILRAAVYDLDGPLSMSDLRKITGLGARTPYAVERAVGHGFMIHVDGIHSGFYYPSFIQQQEADQ